MVIVDEVHERDMLTDFLLVLLREADINSMGSQNACIALDTYAEKNRENSDRYDRADHCSRHGLCVWALMCV